MKIGFTGTQKGMTLYQKRRVFEIVRDRNPELCIHGDCVGADREFHIISKALGVKVEIHPPTDPKKRAFCTGDIVKEPFPYLERDHHIVDACDLMVATPKGMVEELRSGTWATVRYSRKVRKPLIIVYPEKETA